MRNVSALSLVLCALLLGSSECLERKRTVQEVEQCTVSADGEKVCTHSEMGGAVQEDKSGNHSDDGIFDEDKVDDADVVDDDDDDDDDDHNDANANADGGCVDTHEHCAFWASLDECAKNPNYMLKGCPKSCNSCPGKLIDGLTGEQENEKKFLLEAIVKYGQPQEVATETQDKTMYRIRQTLDYMENYIHAEKPTHELSEQTVNACRNTDSRCAFWATLGECENNPAFMVTKCAPSCLSCHKIDFEKRCGERPADLPPGLKHGELNLMYERIVETAPGNASDTTQLLAQERKVQDDGTPYYTVTVHSRPASDSPKPDENGVIPTNEQKDQDEDPWVITFDNFLTDEECEHLINLGYKNGYKRSTDVGKQNLDGSFGVSVGNGRTSENSWCDSKSGCRGDPIAKRVMQRMADVTGISTENYEDLQLLKYEEGQYYRRHHDYIRHQRERHSGPRILTFFLYLSDVEEGGATRLNDLGIDIEPKKGRALLWPSVMNYNPSDKDHRTRHEAREVLKGTKFAANAWIHLFNSVEAQKHGCS